MYGSCVGETDAWRYCDGVNESMVERSIVRLIIIYEIKRALRRWKKRRILGLPWSTSRAMNARNEGLFESTLFGNRDLDTQ